jgi:hypothetical protein
MSYSRKEIEQVLSIVARAPTRTEGYELAAKKLDRTASAIRNMVARVEGRRTGESKPRAAKDVKAPPRDETEPPPAEVKSFTERMTAKAENHRINTLERDHDALRQAVEAMSELTSRPLEPLPRYELKSGMREATSVALLSDAHVDERVHKHETPVGNEYDPEIAERSLARFFLGYRWLINFHRTAFQINRAMLWIGGDLASGHIHDELKETTSGTPIESMLWLRSRLVAGIDMLLEDKKLEMLDAVGSYGNHGRDTKKPMRARGAAHSYEWLLYQWLASHYAGNKRVRFHASPSAHQYAQVYDWHLHFHHGDEVNYGGGVGGITIPLNKAVSQWDIARRCHFHNFGHFHQYIDTGNIAVNGSVIGYNAYAMSIKAKPEPPQQAFYLIDSKRGKTCKSPIWVRE